MSLFSLRRHEKIKRSADFVSVYKKGSRKESVHFKIAISANGLSWRRLGITVGKKTGGSVQRNYIKRCLREYFRLHKLALPAASDIVFTAKPGADHLKYTDMAIEINDLFQIDDRKLNADA
jgi:ribonuclease P protein component